jgi:diguanylate cyclase (GGDEF)-like protein
MLWRLLFVAITAGAASGGVIVALLAVLGHGDAKIHTWVMITSVLSGLVSLAVLQTLLGRRVQRLVSLFERGGRGRRRSSAPSPPTQGEDLGRVIAAVDLLLAEADLGDVASGEGDADALTPVGTPRREEGRRDESRKFRVERDLTPASGAPALSATTLSALAGGAAESHREVVLAKTLAQKTEELQQRLRERALLFELLRESAATLNLESVLERLTTRLGPALELRELAVLLKDDDGRFAIRACWGFPDPDAVLGRILAPGEGVTSSATTTGRAVVLEDVSDSPEYLAFWGEVPRTGSFMSVPIRARDEVIGAIALTRPPDDPLTELEVRFLSALADQIALSIHNAQLFRKLEELSTHDELTKLPNRRYLNERLEREMADARRYGHPLSLMMIDVDHFKKLNDRAGHPIGDEALREVGERIRATLREVDTVARWGGEEFVVLLSRAGEAQAIEVAEKLRRTVADIDTAWSREQPFGHLSVSIGIAELRDGEDAASLVQRADRAVYVAKREGRNRVSGSFAAVRPSERPPSSAPPARS